jgi:hypothetical protein
MIVSTVLAKVFVSILRCMIAPHLPAQRMLNFDDGEARKITWQVSLVVSAAAIILGVNTWLAWLDTYIDPTQDLFDPERDLIATVMSAITVALVSWVCIGNRRAIADAILPPDDRDVPAWKRWLVDRWHIFVVVYFVLAWVVRSIRLLLDRPGAEGLVTAPIPVLFLALGLYGVCMLVIERSMKRLPEMRIGGTDGKRIADYRDLLVGRRSEGSRSWRPQKGGVMTSSIPISKGRARMKS